jgi:hypothetical protein
VTRKTIQHGKRTCLFDENDSAFNEMGGCRIWRKNIIIAFLDRIRGRNFFRHDDFIAVDFDGFDGRGMILGSVDEVTIRGIDTFSIRIDAVLVFVD